MEYERKHINEIKGPMKNDYLELENAKNMPGMIDSTVAMTFLLNMKSGIRNCAIAITEIADPEARTAVRNMLNDGITLHAQLSQLMIDKGWLHPYEVKEQFKLDGLSAQAALQIAGMQLFPGDTSRLGTFATPHN